MPAKDDYKNFKAQYDKCKVVVGKDTAKNAEKLSDQVKFFRYDLLCGLSLLEELVAADKCETEPTEASKIEDYNKNKEIRPVLKDVKWNAAKLAGTSKSLSNLPKLADINSSIKKLYMLNSSIELLRKLNKRNKGWKMDPAIEKLEKQVKSDLKESNDLLKVVKGIPKEYYKAEDLYAVETKKILNTKPRLTSAQKKFNEKVYPNNLEGKELRKKAKECKKASKVIAEQSKLALEAAKKQNSSKMQACLLKGIKEMKSLESTKTLYQKIQDKYKAQIKKAKDKKDIDKGIEEIEDIISKAEEEWENTRKAIDAIPEQ